MVEAQQRKIGLPRLQNEVVVVAHETPGQRATIKALQPRGQDREQSPSVHIVHKDRLPPIPARSHVVNRAGELNAKRACHGGRLNREGGKRQDLTPMAPGWVVG